MRILPLLVLLFSGACDDRTAAEVDTCESLCMMLVVECEYGAFPSVDSCMSGCGYNFSEGADIESQLACVERAGCDTFTILECENAYGRP